MTISGFNRTDSLYLTAFAFQKTRILSYVENAQKTGGTLTLADGTARAAITLFGQYVAAGFHIAVDSGTGTVITYKPSRISSGFHDFTSWLIGSRKRREYADGRGMRSRCGKFIRKINAVDGGRDRD